MEHKQHHLAFIDGLRAIAVLMVFITHGVGDLHRHALATHSQWLSDFESALNLGRGGVVVFFAISGFVIPSSLHDKSGESVRFILSRFFRLFPAFWVSLIVSSAAAYWIGGIAIASDDFWLNATMLPRWFGAPFLNGGYWTLELELIFYAAALFIFLGSFARNQFVTSCLMFGGFLVFLTSQQPIFGGALNPALSADTFYLCLHLSCMFWGALAREVYDRRIEPIPGILFAVVTVYWLVYRPLQFALGWYESGQFEYPALLMITGYSLALAIFLVGMATSFRPGRFISWLGRVSYSFYLMQPPAILLTFYLIGVMHLEWMPVVIGLALMFGINAIFSELAFRFIEAPSNRLGKAAASWGAALTLSWPSLLRAAAQDRQSSAASRLQ